MPPLIECVPNFSEGKDPAVLAALRTAVTSVPGVHLLDVHADAWHHRSVFTFVGPADAVAEAAVRGARCAVERIDLTRHRGEHPRIGAVDVIPFVPLDGATMDACVALAKRVGARISEELDVPVFLYARAARRPERVQLWQIRRSGFERLRESIGADGAYDPDFGPRRIHPTAGATAVGARPILVAYNVVLDTDDVALARRIAGSIRTVAGGLPAVQARGFLVDGKAQISTNLLDVDITPPKAVFDAVVRRARAAGVEVASSEIVGLAPERAVPPNAERVVRLGVPVETRILERRIRDAMQDERARPARPPRPP
jgi:glutamate formiminotransferase